ncbi:gamma-D-glutamyl-meso-diaminopimelate peptidase [Lactobacillus sp. CBA3606]|uniref:C40 family peptidase n=1 Tax=Lactobacillus sp. CBA3606 TaxID=2099789 RepID=UPI000CFBCFA0|nr:C40 family peptidase [Lactobacillus sp. CBA3606]AVK63231.1 gamma-D-glutamyl-meso-diaminopimelate peptidase [Lactobacillus sp. CBA3606]
MSQAHTTGKVLASTVGAVGLLLATGQAANAASVTVKQNDTVWGLAQQHGVSVKSIEKLNQQALNGNTSLIYVGQKLQVSGKSGQTSSAKGTYTVKAGDTLWDLADAYQTTVQKLQKLNGLSSDLIVTGQTLKVSGTSTQQSTRSVAKTSANATTANKTSVAASSSATKTTTDNNSSSTAATSASSTSQVSASSAASTSSSATSDTEVQGSVSASLSSSTTDATSASSETSSSQVSSSAATSASSTSAVAESVVLNTVATSSSSTTASQSSSSAASQSSSTASQSSSSASQSSSVASQSSSTASQSSTTPASQSSSSASQSTSTASASSSVATQSSSAASQSSSTAATTTTTQSSSSAATSTASQASSSSQAVTTSSSSTATASTSDLTTGSVTSLALKLADANIPYVWGGASLSGMDCSGLVSYVFQHAAGISLPHNTVSQEGYVTTHSVADAKPGDILFWGSRGSTWHDAIYIGNNQYVAAPTEGENVQVQTISTYFAPSFAGTVN